MQPRHWLEIAKAIEDHYDNYDGFVICHGTDTMAYTSCSPFLSCTEFSKTYRYYRCPRNLFDMENTDARTNLSDSLRFASDDKAYDVNIVFDGKVISGTRGKKERTKSYNAFSSINFPYIATIQDGHVIFYLDDKKHTLRQTCIFP